jgi:hypothetical protein
MLVLYRTLEHSAIAPAKADACVASLAATSHLVEHVTPFTIPAYPFSHGPSFNFAFRLALRAHDAHAPRVPRPCGPSLSGTAYPYTTVLTDLRSSTSSYESARPQIVHLAPPNFVGVPPGTGEMCSTAVPNLTTSAARTQAASRSSGSRTPQ